MAKLESILCAVDFSAASIAALRRAVTLARKDAAAVHVLHVVALPWMPYAEAGVLVAGDFEAQIRARAERALAELVASETREGVALQPHLVTGIEADSILHTAERLGCDLVVVGASGRRGVVRYVLGSVAERVVRTSPVDVLTVPAGAESSSTSAIRTITCAVDFSTASEAAFLHALDLARRHGAALHVAHAWEAAPFASRTSELAASYERDLARDLEALVHRHPAPDVAITRHVRFGIPYVEIAKLAAELRSDLLITGTKGKTGLEHFLLGSVAERIVRASAVPVLTVREARKTAA